MRLNSLFLVLVILMTLAPLLAFSAGPARPAGFEILSESTNGIDIRFNLPAWNYQSSASRDPELKRVQIDEAQYLFFEEQESLPIFSATIAIPYSGNANLSVVNTRHRMESNIRLEFDAELTQERASGKYRDSIYPAQYIQISEPMIMRDFRIVTVNVYPFQYDQDRRELSVNESIDFHLSYDAPDSSPLTSANLRLSKSLESIYRGLILNYDSLITRDTVYQAPVMLVIYGNYTDATYISKVNEYAAWKRQKGYKVFTASTAVAGTTTTSIKNYIQNAYNTWADRPEYIVLIGDVGGTIAIPTYTYSGSEGDYQYTWLAGNDILGDAAIGRISVSSLDEMLVYMAKLTSLERNINLDTAAWLNRMLLVGDTSSSGISTVYTNHYIRELSDDVNPAYTYTELYQSGPSPATMNTAMNEGVAFFNYRGYIGMSGWNSTYISQLNNSYKLFHAVIITCATGSFAGTSTTELVVRKGTVAQLGGAITAIGMATSSTHTPMNNCLDQAIFHGIYGLGMRDMGAPLYYSKLYLNAVYGNSNPSQAQFFAQMCNLIGDPTAIVYVGMPNSFTVTHPSSIPAQTGAIEVTVRNAQNQLVENAVVTLTNSVDLQVMAITGSNGRALLTIPTTLSGSITLTVSKNEFKPLVGTITITSGGIVYQ
ncbi:MAG: C25 family cysteine peptidase, partial [Candidatus Cloacimonadaceae bacterium]|nr:C25 family cysteine peptidase [Candidatus Cloacimonadaceae bacterium]